MVQTTECRISHLANYKAIDIYSYLLQANTARVVFSWNDNDPTMPDGSDAMQHTTNDRGSASLNLLGGLRSIPPDPSDTRSFAFTVNNVCVFLFVVSLSS